MEQRGQLKTDGAEINLRREALERVRAAMVMPPRKASLSFVPPTISALDSILKSIVAKEKKTTSANSTVKRGAETEIESESENESENENENENESASEGEGGNENGNENENAITQKASVPEFRRDWHRQCGRMATAMRRRTTLKGYADPALMKRDDILQRLDEQDHRSVWSNIPFTYFDPIQGVRLNFYNPSPDRIDTDVGYRADNIQFITVQENIARNDTSIDDFFSMCVHVVLNKRLLFDEEHLRKAAENIPGVYDDLVRLGEHVLGMEDD